MHMATHHGVAHVCHIGSNIHIAFDNDVDPNQSVATPSYFRNDWLAIAGEV